MVVLIFLQLISIGQTSANLLYKGFSLFVCGEGASLYRLNSSRGIAQAMFQACFFSNTSL